jgi:hypothetical protein
LYSSGLRLKATAQNKQQIVKREASEKVCTQDTYWGGDITGPLFPGTGGF